MPKIRHWGDPQTLRIGAFAQLRRGCRSSSTVTVGPIRRPLTPFLSAGLQQDTFRRSRWLDDVVIGNDAWIGSNTTTLSGVTKGDKSSGQRKFTPATRPGSSVHLPIALLSVGIFFWHDDAHLLATKRFCLPFSEKTNYKHPTSLVGQPRQRKRASGSDHHTHKPRPEY